MRERWLSRRALALHVAAVVAFTGCALATWWQITRAEDGNQLSYFYSAMWPTFAILVVYFWWSLLHTDFESVGRRGVQRQQARGAVPDAAVPDASVLDGDVLAAAAATVSAEDDPELAAYNARLSALAAQGPKTWRRREPVVVRTPGAPAPSGQQR